MQNARELTLLKSSAILGKGRGGGKPGHLELSRMTEAPLATYLALRQERTAEWGDRDLLLVRPGPGGLCPVSLSYISYRIVVLSDKAGYTSALTICGGPMGIGYTWPESR